MELAAKTLVKLGLLPGSKGAESFEFDIKRAFEWLSEERNENKRHAAVLVLRELAVTMPTFFFQQISNFFGHIFSAIFDPKPAIRECAGQALRAALVVTTQRESAKSQNKQLWYRQCYDDAIASFGEVPARDKGVTRDDRIHGGLIVLNEILRCSNVSWERRHMGLKSLRPEELQRDGSQTLFPRLKIPFTEKKSPTKSAKEITHKECYPKLARQVSVPQESNLCRQLVIDNYEEICTKVLDQRVSRSLHVHQVIMSILPRLAAFNREVFVKRHLKVTVNHLMATLKGKEKDKNFAFATIGYIAVAVEHDIEPYIPRIVDLIKQTLPSREFPTKKKSGFDYSVFDCITLLSHAIGPAITNEVKDILESMYSTGLSPALTVCLREVAENIPSLKRDISEGLIRMLTNVLMTKPISQMGTPKHGPLSQITALTIADTQPDTATIVLALKTLGTFNFESQTLLPFVQRCADYFLVHDQQEVRLQAVVTTCRLMRLSIYIHSMEDDDIGETLKETTSNVLERLLTVGITDNEPKVRLQVLRSLDQTFDPQLAQPWFLSSLLLTMNDEVFEIRELAVITIGRLSSLNPAYVMPNLRKTLVQLLTELEHSGMSRSKEQSARMLDHLIVHTPRLMSSYMRPILTVLVPKLREPESNPGVILNVLRTIGDLSELNSGTNGIMDQWTDDLLSILIEMLSDAGAPNKRGVALWTLGQLVSATGQCVTPYNTYPNLIDILINFLKTETQPAVRRETIRVLGLLGALDPYKHKMNRGLIDNANDTVLISTDTKCEEMVDLSTAEMLVNMQGQLEEFYPAVAISTLMKILKDQTLSHHHTSVVQAITFIFKSLGIKSREYLPQVLPIFLSIIRTAELNLREFLFQQLSILIEIVKQHSISYIDDVFKLIKEFWIISTPLQATLINLVEKIAVALGCEFRVYLAQLMPQILKVLHHDSRERIVTGKLLVALQKFDSNLDDYLHLVLPPIVKLFEPVDVPVAISNVAFETINHLAQVLDFTDYSSRIIHPLVRVIDNYPDLRQVAISTLCSLMIQLGKKYLVFVPLVNRVFTKHRLSPLDYLKLLNKLQSSTTICMDEEFRIKQMRFRGRESSVCASDPNTIRKLNVSSTDLQVAWQAARRVSKDDWLEWLRRLSDGLLKESQSPALRSCRPLAQNYPQLLRDLFNAAFVSCWTGRTKISTIKTF